MIRLLLVDDHAVVRQGYRRLLEQQGNIVVAGEAATGALGLQRWRELQPDLAILDLALPDIGGLELLARIRQRDPQARLLAFSMHRDVLWAVQAIRAGALGYVTKSSPPEVLQHAVREVAGGRSFVSPDLAAEVRAALREPDPPATNGLSPRELEVLRLLLAGTPVADIATALFLSAKTVHNTHYQIKAKLGAANDFELVRLARRLGLGD
ncbi:DNA-binding response regulator [Azoarcus sp. DD4]|uniref:response regulator transcription factor n=1 Tax=Azoarcus sp. DD4 TaxID=2027405 RepID=UPI001126CC0A|nr:response regulator transcription factor [Azoarcus sp. DD4]QDF96705.1 DNA-binding response regulator [Azoarcus sp. DD4]